MAVRQIKSKERVANFGEVYTAAREVNSMLDLVKDEASRIDSTFLEPACGDGNFLVEIFRRKMETVKNLYGGSAAQYELYSILAVSSIYGVDIQRDNVEAAKARMFDQFFVEYVRRFHRQPSLPCQMVISFILNRNIQCGNTLTYCTEDNDPLIISEWEMDDGGAFIRRDYSYQSLVETGCKAAPVKVYPRISYPWLCT